jgi:hypothetical protein
MDARIMRSLAELIAEHHRQNRQDYNTDQYSDFDTTVSHDLDEDSHHQAWAQHTDQLQE